MLSLKTHSTIMSDFANELLLKKKNPASPILQTMFDQKKENQKCEVAWPRGCHLKCLSCVSNFSKLDHLSFDSLRTPSPLCELSSVMNSYIVLEGHFYYHVLSGVPAYCVLQP